MSTRRVVPVALALVVAACSSSGRSLPATTSPPATTTAEPARSTTTTTTTTVPWADAGALAAELSAVEAGIRAPSTSPAELAALGRRQQLAYRAANRHPEWHEQLLATVDSVAQVPLSFHLAARQAQVDHAAGKPAAPVDELPAWTIVEPLPIDELMADYRDAEAASGVPWQYLAAINFQETRMGRIVGVSSAGAVGPMQFLPSTWAACCEGDPTVARDAILGAAHYLVQHGAPADMQAALYAYNPNAGYVGAVTAYAGNMLADERAYLGYHGWDVFYTTSAGTVRLPVGYAQTAPVDALAYLADHPADLVPTG